MRQVQHLLAVVLLHFWRQGDGVGNQVIEIRNPHGAGVAKIMHLYGRWAVRQNFRTRAARVAFQIDCDIDFHFAQHGGAGSTAGEVSADAERLARERGNDLADPCVNRRVD